MISAKPIVLLLTALALGGCDVTSGGFTGTGPTAASGMFGTGTGDGVMARAYAGSRSLIDGSRGAIGSALGKVGFDQSEPFTSTNSTTEKALRGLLGDRLGAVLDESDRRFAYQAQLDALDRSAPGAPTAWRNPASGHFGNIVAGPFYERGGASCRGFSHSISAAGHSESARGTACRSSDGAWAAAG